MVTDKTSLAAKEPATPATAKRTVKRAAKPATEKPVKATPKLADKKPEKTRKVKVVRDSFTMPQEEYKEIAKIKDACRKAGLPVKKSEVLRAGLKILGELNMAQMKRLLAGLKKVKAVRSAKP